MSTVKPQKFCLELIEVVNFIAFSNSNVTGSGTGTLGGVMPSVLDYIMRRWSDMIY